MPNGMPLYGDVRVVKAHFVSQARTNADLRAQIEGQGVSVDTLYSSHLPDVQSQLEQLSVKFGTLQHDFDHFINEHYLPLQAAVSLFSSLCHPSSIPPPCQCHNQARGLGLFNKRFPGFNTLSQESQIILLERVSSKPIFRPATPEPGSSPSSPSFSIPPLKSCSSDSDDEAFQDASSNLLPIEEGGSGSDEAEVDSEDDGVSVWEGMCAGGVREDSL